MWPSKAPLLKSACETLVIYYYLVIVISQIATSVPPPKSNLPYPPYPVTLLLPMNGRNVSSIHMPPQAQVHQQQQQKQQLLQLAQVQLPKQLPQQQQQQQRRPPPPGETRAGRMKLNSNTQFASLITGGEGDERDKQQVTRTSSCFQLAKSMSMRVTNVELACFPLEACHQWYSPLTSSPNKTLTYNNRLTWPACQWKKGPDYGTAGGEDKWIPVSVCCPKPSFSMEENPVRTLTKSLYELPIKKAHVTLSNKRQEDEFGHCGKVQLKTTPAARTIDKKSHLIYLQKGTNSIYSVTSPQEAATFSPVHPPFLPPPKMAPVAPKYLDKGSVTFNNNNFNNNKNNNVLNKRYKRIVGGFTTSIQYHPWMASIFIRGRYECGAVIIHPRVLVTSAHCFKGNYDVSRVEAMVASHHLASGKVRKVSQIIVHPAYKEPSIYDDIALVVLKHLLPLGPSVFPVCLRKFGTNELKEGLTATIIGYGSYFYGGPMPDLLQETSVQIRSSDACSRMYSKVSAKILSKGIPSSLICAGTTGRVTDACQGDSGGPLTISINGHSVLIGIVSFGFKCAELPGVYTSTSYYIDWINKQIKDLTGV